MPSVTQARLTKWPVRVATRTRSPEATPSRAASSTWIHTGLLFDSSYNHLALAEREWIRVGRRKVGTSANWFSPARSAGCTCERT